MEEKYLQLRLNRTQREQLFAHLLVYLLKICLNPLVPAPSEAEKAVGELMGRLHCLRLYGADTAPFLVSVQEGRLLKEILLLLGAVYGLWPDEESTKRAMQDLKLCLELLRYAQQELADKPREGK